MEFLLDHNSSIIIFFIICILIIILTFSAFVIKDKENRDSENIKRLKDIGMIEVYFYCEKYQKWYCVRQTRIYPTIVKEYRYNDTLERSPYNWYRAEWNNPDNLVVLFLNYVLENYINHGTTLAYDHKFLPLLKTVSSKIYLVIEENYVRTTYSYDYRSFYEPSNTKKEKEPNHTNNYPSFYDFFNLNLTATFDDFKLRYKLLAKKYHPDNKNTGDACMMTKINMEFESVKVHFKRK